MKVPLRVAVLYPTLVAFAVLSQFVVGCPKAPDTAGTQSARADAALARESATAGTCAPGWTQAQQDLCVRLSKLEPCNEPPVDLVALDLLSKTDYVHLGLRVADFRGPEKWCAFPTVLSLSQIEANHEYAFKVPCSLSGKPLEAGEFRLVVEVEEAIEMHSAH